MTRLNYRLGPRSGDLAVLGAGVLTVLAFAPFDLYPLAILTALALLWLWQGQSPRRAAWRGFLFGLGQFGAGIYWVYISLHHYGNAPPAFAALTTLLLILLMALYPALIGYLLIRLTPHPGPLQWLLAAPALWALVEWVRSWLFTGFPWLALGYSQSDSVLGHLAPYLGVFGVGWAAILSAGLLLTLIHKHRLRALWTVVLIGLWLSAWGLGQVRWTEPAGEPLNVSLVQGNIPQQQKFQPGSLEATLGRYLELSRPVNKISDLIVWPETAIPIFYDEAQTFVEFLTLEARASNTDYLIGIPSGSWDTGLFHNSIISLGKPPRFYHKRRLLPFGEYLPLRFIFDFFHRLVDIPLADFTPGGVDQTLLQAAGHPVGTSICFEAVFGSEIRLSLPQAHFLVNVSNDAWFGHSLAPHQHLQIARMRAIETQRYMARATNTGISAIIDARGRITRQGGSFVSDTVQGTVQPLVGATPYVRFGDTLTVLIMIMLWLIGIAGYRLKDKR